MYLSLFLTLYMFPVHRAHHQERQIVSIQHLVAVTLCRWPCRVQVGSEMTNVTHSPFLCLFIFLTLYMFRAHRAHHQERQIVSIQHLVAVGGRVVCRSEVK